MTPGRWIQLFPCSFSSCYRRTRVTNHQFLPNKSTLENIRLQQPLIKFHTMDWDWPPSPPTQPPFVQVLSAYKQLWHNDSPWTHPALSQRASTSEKTKKQGNSDFPFALKLVLERLARVQPAYSHGNCDGTSTILIICASLLANFYDRVLHRSERAVRGITKQTRPQKSHLK